ncbi:MAG: hypothetical protein JO345_26850 [Streptosporangiaceae bacterium]|nr:hypothetical protein [Streptosporangiaceae bacterium]
MHPYITMNLVHQQRQEAMRHAAESRRGPVRRFPRWHLSWSRMNLASAGQRGSAVMIIITAHRPA